MGRAVDCTVLNYRRVIDRTFGSDLTRLSQSIKYMRWHRDEKPPDPGCQLTSKQVPLSLSENQGEHAHAPGAEPSTHWSTLCIDVAHVQSSAGSLD